MTIDDTTAALLFVVAILPIGLFLWAMAIDAIRGLFRRDE